MKGKLFFLDNYLQANTDAEHPISAEDLIAVCNQNGFSANRNTLRDDIASLIDQGTDIQKKTIARKAYYYYGKRLFDVFEIRMLIDAVASAQFINPELTSSLIDRLKSTAGVHSSNLLYAGVPVPKTDCTEMRNNLRVICQAIDSGKKIRFRYYTYTPEGEKCFRHDGAYYSFSPYEIACNDCRYYVIGFHEARDIVSQFRIDLISSAEIVDEPITIAPDDYDPGQYGKTVFRMFPGERIGSVTLECCNDLMFSIIDRFGSAVKPEHATKETFRVNVDVSISNTFFGWVAQYGGRIRIVAPADVRAQYAEFGKMIWKQHQMP